MSLPPPLAKAKARLREAGIPSYALDAELLLAHVLGISREQVVFFPKKEVSPTEMAKFEGFVARREAREPMAHLLGKREFFGRDFTVTKDTLDPRPDSETLIEAVLKAYPNRNLPLKILDFGTGTGCLLLTLLCEFPNAEGRGVDKSPAALDVAKKNARELKLETRVAFEVNNWGEGLAGTYDAIITNPPYIKEEDVALLAPEVSRFEPRLALVGGEDGLACYRELAPHIARLLASDGKAVLEFGQGQAEDVAAIMEENQMEVVAYHQDLAGITRCITVQRSKRMKRVNHV